MTKTEIERKFLVDWYKVPCYEYEKRYYITQIYVGKARIRIQSEDRYEPKKGKAFLTVKKGTGLGREEKEVKMDFNIARTLVLNSKEAVTKRREIIPLPNSDLKAELDYFFDSPLGQFYMVEVEFPSVEDAKAFIAPYWFGKEVTDDENYKNANLLTPHRRCYSGYSKNDHKGFSDNWCCGCKYFEE